MVQGYSSQALLRSFGRTGGGRKNHCVRSRLKLATAIGDDAIDDQKWNRGRCGGFLWRDRLVGFNRSHFLAGISCHHKRGQSLDSEREGDVGLLAARSRRTVVGIASQGVIDRGQLYPRQYLDNRTTSVHPALVNRLPDRKS